MAKGTGNHYLDCLPEDGERKLMLAVLVDAIHAYEMERPVKFHAHRTRLWLRERRWFEAEDPSHSFSFRSICDALGLDPDYIRHCVFGKSQRVRPKRVRRYTTRAEQTWEDLSRRFSQAS